MAADPATGALQESDFSHINQHYKDHLSARSSIYMFILFNLSIFEHLLIPYGLMLLSILDLIIYQLKSYPHIIIVFN